MDWLNAPYSSWLTVLARLRPDVAPRLAQAALDALYGQLADLNVRTEGHRYRLQVEPASRGIAELQARFENPLWILMGITGLVLLIACSNLANLLLGRATARTHEMGVRLALGAGRARLVRQLLTESCVLSGLGAAAALVLSWRGARALVALAAAGEKWQLPLDPDLRILGFTAAVAMVATCLFGLAPALVGTRIDVRSALQGSRRSQTSGRPRQALGKVLVAAQISISLLLLSAAALLVGSLWNLRHQDFGFRSEGLLMVDLPLEFTPNMRARSAALSQPLFGRMNALPGVRSAAICGFGPMGGWQHTSPVSAPERPAQQGELARIVHVSPRYFETMGMRMVAGRSITEEDRAGAPQVAVLSETAARVLFGGANPVGRLVTTGRQFDAKSALQVVGVAHDVRFGGPREPYGVLLYVPMAQGQAPVTEVLVRASGDAGLLVGTVRAALQDVVTGLPIGEIRRLSDTIDTKLANERMLALLATCFGLLALALTCVGVYGVVSYAVERRTQEIGIRLALGASRGAVAGMLMRDVALLVAASAVLGGAGAVAATRAIHTMLFGFGPNDYSMLLWAGLLLMVVAVAAGYAPARRAARLDPMDALRQE
jgi:predicted permease